MILIILIINKITNKKKSKLINIHKRKIEKKKIYLINLAIIVQEEFNPASLKVI